jgi:hypothetical protein
MMNKLLNCTNHMAINIAVAIANGELKSSSPLMVAISKKHDWKYVEWPTSGFDVVNQLLSGPKQVNVFLYRPLNPWSSARAKFQNGAIHLNVHYVNKKTTTIQKLIGSLVHEYCHAAGFGHGNNYRTKNKERYSVPFWAGIEAAGGDHE